MLRSIACAAILSLLAASTWACEQSNFRAAQFPDAKTTTEDRRKIIDELRLKYQATVDDLGKNNTSAATRAKQKDIADLLDKLLNQDSDTPPSGSPPTSNPPPTGNKNSPPMPMSSTPEPDKSKEHSPTPAAAKPTPMSETPPRIEAGEPKKGQAELERAPMSLDELQKQNHVQPWRPVLPPRVRQDIDAYAAERFMPRYEDLLRAYYRTLGESSRRKDGE